MKLIGDWEGLTNKITENWIANYFELEENEEVDYYWIGEEIGGVFEFADYYFNFSDILNCYKHNINREQLFLWYEYCLQNGVIDVSLTEFILAPEEKAKRDMEELERLKNNVKLAKKEFKNALKRI